MAKKKSLGSEILTGLQDAVAFERGNTQGATTRRVTLTARDSTAEPAPVFSSEQIARMRERLDLSQALFAQALNVSPETIRSWEQGKRVPEGAALRLLQIAEEYPHWILRAIRSTRDHEPPVAFRAALRKNTQGKQP